MQKYNVFVISGGTGFIGSQLISYLTNINCKVYVLTRSKNKVDTALVKYLHWQPSTKVFDGTVLEKNICVIHLAGASVATKRWTEAYKIEIIQSRLQSTEFLWQLINTQKIDAQYFIGASATGYYGENKSNGIFTETDIAATDYLASTCLAWEDAVNAFNANNLPVCIFRIGMVLGTGGGAVPNFMQSLQFGIAGVAGNGKQIYPWVHIYDVIEAMMHATKHNLNDTYNLVSPQSANAKTIINNLAKANGKRFIHAFAPAFVLKIILGEFSTEVLKSVSVSAQKLLDTNFKFTYANITDACMQIIASTKKATQK